MTGFVLACGIAAAQSAPTEDQLKAAFLLNFPKYVEWPADTFADEASPIVVTVIGDPSVEGELRRLSEGKLFNGRPLEVRSGRVVEPVAADVQIVFIGLADERSAREVIARLGPRSILTVGECDDFFDDGGVIKLVRRERKIRLEVNLAAPGARDLKISSKLLSVAEVVKRRDN